MLRVIPGAVDDADPLVSVFAPPNLDVAVVFAEFGPPAAPPALLAPPVPAAPEDAAAAVVGAIAGIANAADTITTALIALKRILGSFLKTTHRVTNAWPAKPVRGPAITFPRCCVREDGAADDEVSS